MTEQIKKARVTIIIDSEDGSQEVYSGLQGLVHVGVVDDVLDCLEDRHFLSLRPLQKSFTLTIDKLENSYDTRQFYIVKNNPVKKPLTDSEVKRVVKKAMDDIRTGL